MTWLEPVKWAAVLLVAFEGLVILVVAGALAYAKVAKTPRLRALERVREAATRHVNLCEALFEAEKMRWTKAASEEERQVLRDAEVSLQVALHDAR